MYECIQRKNFFKQKNKFLESDMQSNVRKFYK